MHYPAFLLIVLPTIALTAPTVALGAAPAPVYGKSGVVAADHPLASQAGIEILKAGGNAVDAACATAFVLGVVNPAGSGIGGGGFMVLRKSDGEAPVVLDFRESAPRGTSRKTFTQPGVNASASRRGGLAIAVPGEVAGCALAVKRYGKISLARVLAPAIRVAKRGFPAGHQLVKAIGRVKAHFGRFDVLGKTFAPGGKSLTFGQRGRRPKLARALAAIARKGPGVFYRGWIAKDIVASAKKYGGVLTLADLANYKVKIRKPIVAHFGGYDVFTMPPPSSGGIVIATALNILGGRDLVKLGHNSSTYLHLLTETLKHTFSDRARFIGDPDFVKVPTQELIAPAYGRALASRIGPKVQPIKSYGSKTVPKAPVVRDAGTSHLAVIDRWGNAASMTSSVNTYFGSLVMGQRSGVVLNNTMDDFTTRPGKPNFFGLIQSEKNSVAPQKRPLSSMTPTLVVKDGKTRLVLGGSGGPTIITGTLQVLLNVVAFKMNVADAVQRSRIHHQWMPDEIWVESDLPADVVNNLKRRGQKIKRVNKPFTAVQAAAAIDGALTGASDPRKYGASAAY